MVVIIILSEAIEVSSWAQPRSYGFSPYLLRGFLNIILARRSESISIADSLTGKHGWLSSITQMWLQAYRLTVRDS